MTTLLLLIIFLIFFMYLTHMKYNKKIEHYLDIIPTYLLDNISRCYTSKCIINESYKCNEYCNLIEQPNARENCRMSCSDFGDIVFKYQSYENAIFGSSINKLVDYSLLNSSA
jgi:hypothetical protein